MNAAMKPSKKYGMKLPESARLFQRLRSEMTLRGLTNIDIFALIERSPQHVSRGLNGGAEFTLSEQYKILHYIGRLASDMLLIFPDGGIIKRIERRVTHKQFYSIKLSSQRCAHGNAPQ
ncbi:MAG: hypothetical protein ACOYJD_06150 [Christensenellales bacterium]|jgi:hypothetical protein